MLDFRFGADVAVMRMMKKKFALIEQHAKARAMRRLDGGAKMMQQRFDLAPVNVAAQRVMKNRMQKTLVFMAHGFLAAVFNQ